MKIKIDLMQFSVEELKKAIEKKEEQSKVVKEGFLKHDLYTFLATYDGQPTSFCIESVDSVEDYWCMTSGEVTKIKKKFASSFSKFMEAGTRFVCYMVEGQEYWYDDVNWGLEEMCAEWADKNLRDIRPV